MEQVNEAQPDAVQGTIDAPEVNYRYGVVLGDQVINAILWDGNETPTEESETPLADSVAPALLIRAPDGLLVSPGWTYENGAFVEPPLPVPPPMTADQALAEKTARIAHATTMIAPLQDMVDLGEATPEEEAALLAWKRYRIALTRLTTTSPGWPSNLAWPEMPA